MNIHDYERRYKLAQKRINNSDISERNKELIFSFLEDLVLENLSKPRLIKYMDTMLLVVRRLGMDLDKAEKDDIKKLVAQIQQDDYSPWTKQCYNVMIRRFYKWLMGTPDYPEIVSWISIRLSRSERKLPSEGDLLTEEDVQKLIKVAGHIRDKAFLSALWESGARVSEIGNLCLKHVVFDKHGTVISVKGKTGSRKVRLVSSTPYLSTLLNTHPEKNNPEARLWLNVGTTNHNKPMNYSAIRIVLKRLFAKAGINKRCNPHIFRHSRATFMANHLTEFQMNQYFGWQQGSDMPSTYVHMSGREVDGAILAMNGMTNRQEHKEAKIQPRICPRCDTLNAYDSRHCSKCGGILDLKHAMELEAKREEQQKERDDADNMMSRLMKDREVQAFLMEKMKELSNIMAV